jgi:isoquinoline 1-oxidoreductase
MSMDHEEHQIIEPVPFDFGLQRRTFVQLLATGLMVATAPLAAEAQRSGGGRGRGNQTPVNPSARIHIGKDSIVTVLTGKVEVGQGSRAEISQAVAEELRVPIAQVQVTMADTAVVPNDGITAGSGTTPRTIPSVRAAAAATRNVLRQLASQRWNVEISTVEIRNGQLVHEGTNWTLTFAELSQDEEFPKLLAKASAQDSDLVPVKDWQTLGTPVPRPNNRAVVTGEHRYSSDVKRPGMLRGKVLRAPTYGAKLVSADLSPTKDMKDVTVVQDGSFVGAAAPSTFAANEAIEAVGKTARWEPIPLPSSHELHDWLRKHVEGGIPENKFSDEIKSAKQVLRATYKAAYIQHAPMETRAAVAEWDDGKLTVWTGTQNPFGVRRELAAAFHISEDLVRVITPDTGGGFGGKHTGEAALEAARLARASGKPVSLKWTRDEEFTWAYFRPAALIDAEATLDADGKLTSWHFININSGPSAINAPYVTGKRHEQFLDSGRTLRHGSYRALASTANNFGRECFMDELAAAAKQDPLDFRLAHLQDERIKAVLEEAAKRFSWRDRVKQKRSNIGVGLACGTEKGSVVAACVEVRLEPGKKRIVPVRISQVFECGAILNPANLKSQVEGAIIMGLGGALREGMRFENGRMLNASFGEYQVPRFSDLPEIDVQLLNRRDPRSDGAGETPIIAIAPAIANAVFNATGERLREMPLRFPTTAS